MNNTVNSLIVTGDDDQPCECCESRCPPTGYWKCPECDAEWPEEEEGEDE